MALPIDVSSIDALRDAREAMILFTEDAQGALGAMESEIRHVIDWLTHDQRMYWQAEVKRRHQALTEARAELHRKQLSQMHGENPHDSEQREMVRVAKQRLEVAEEKVELVRQMLPILEHAVMEYQTQARPFADLLEFDAKRSTEMLDRMIDALEDYRRESAPSPRPPQGSESQTGQSIAARAGVVSGIPKTPPDAEEVSETMTEPPKDDI